MDKANRVERCNCILDTIPYPCKHYKYGKCIRYDKDVEEIDQCPVPKEIKNIVAKGYNSEAEFVADRIMTYRAAIKGYKEQVHRHYNQLTKAYNTIDKLDKENFKLKQSLLDKEIALMEVK